MTIPALVIIPVHRDPDVNPFILRPLGGASPLQRTVDFARQLREDLAADLDVSICIASNDADISAAAAGFDNILLTERREEDLHDALAEAADQCDTLLGRRAEYVFVLEPLHPLRPATLPREAWSLMEETPSLDSVVCVEALRGRVWAGDEMPEPVSDTFSRGNAPATAAFRELVGLLLLSRRAVIDQGLRVGADVGLVVLNRKWAFVDVRSEENFRLAECFAAIVEDGR